MINPNQLRVKLHRAKREQKEQEFEREGHWGVGFTEELLEHQWRPTRFVENGAQTTQWVRSRTQEGAKETKEEGRVLK